MPMSRGGPSGPNRNSAADAMRKAAEKAKSSARSVTIGPDGQVIVTSSGSKSSDASDSKDAKDKEKDKDSKDGDSKESKNE
jgi:hypothetical protein